MVGAGGCRASEILDCHDEVGLSWDMVCSLAVYEGPTSGLGDFLSLHRLDSKGRGCRVWTQSLQRLKGSVTPSHPPHRAARHDDEKGTISGKDRPSGTYVRLHALDSGWVKERRGGRWSMVSARIGGGELSAIDLFWYIANGMEVKNV